MGNVRDKKISRVACQLDNSEQHPTSRYSQGKSHDICPSMIPASLAPTLPNGQAGVDQLVPSTRLVLLQKNCEVAESEKEILNSQQFKEISFLI